MARKTQKSFVPARNLCRACSDYLYEAPGWNLSPIMFQPGSFLLRQVERVASWRYRGWTHSLGGLGYCGVKLVGQGHSAKASHALD
jgi:hypothetical protein